MMINSPAVLYLDRNGPSTLFASPLHKGQRNDRIDLGSQDQSVHLFPSSTIHDTSLLTKYQEAFKSLLQYHVKQEDIILSNKKRRRQSADIEQMLKGLNEIVSTPLKVRMSIGDKSELYALAGAHTSSSPSRDGQTFVTIIETPSNPPTSAASSHSKKLIEAAQQNKSPYKSSPFKLTPTHQSRPWLASSSQQMATLQQRERGWITSSSKQPPSPRPSPRLQSPSGTRSHKSYRPTSSITKTSSRQVEQQERLQPTKRDPLVIYFSMVPTPGTGVSSAAKPLPLMMASPSDLRLLRSLAVGVESMLTSTCTPTPTRHTATKSSSEGGNTPCVPTVCPPTPPLPPPVRLPITPTRAISNPSYPRTLTPPRASLTATRHTPSARRAIIGTPRTRSAAASTPLSSGRRRNAVMNDANDLLSEIEAALRGYG